MWVGGRPFVRVDIHASHTMQQVTISLPPQHPVRAMQGLARQIALPGEYAPERFPSFPALERTAVMAFSTPASIDLKPNTPLKMMLARQAAWPAWCDQEATAWVYSATWKCSRWVSTSTTVESILPSESLVSWGSGTVNVNINSPSYSAFALHNYAYLGVDAETGPTPFIWVPSGAKLMVVVGYEGNNATQTSAFTVDAETWSSPGEVQRSQFAGVGLANVGGAASNNYSVGGVWVRPRQVVLVFGGNAALVDCNPTVTFVVGSDNFTYAGASGNPGVVSVGLATNTLFLPLVAPAEFANSPLPWMSTRLTAVSLLGTNVTQVLNKGGTILGGRIAPSHRNPFNVTSSIVNALHPAEKAWLPLETGIYTYCPPSTDMANFWDYTLNTGSGAAACPVYRLDNPALVNVMFLTPVAVAENVAVTVSHHVEFRTSSALFQIALSGMTLETLHAAQLSLAAAGFFFHNPDHKSVLTKIMSAVKLIAPMVHPLVGAAVSAYDQYAGKKKVPVPTAKMVMPPTSAAASGIVTKVKRVAGPKPKKAKVASSKKKK